MKTSIDRGSNSEEPNIAEIGEQMKNSPMNEEKDHKKAKMKVDAKKTSAEAAAGEVAAEKDIADETAEKYEGLTRKSLKNYGARISPNIPEVRDQDNSPMGEGCLGNQITNSPIKKENTEDRKQTPVGGKGGAQRKRRKIK